ncbi:MAG TPA: GH25 family lysozyme, partial [Holophagaceae bacterium]|nr:GH25 family lysozyme [Holophagaceae bacterium]
DGALQAQHFLDTVKAPIRKAELLVLDFEPNPGGSSMSLEDAELFVHVVQEQTGKWPGLYSGSYIKALLGTARDTLLANCWFWLAQYGPLAKVPPAWPGWTLWQYSDGTVGPDPRPVPGVGHCDLDVFNGDEAALQAFWTSGISPIVGTA